MVQSDVIEFFDKCAPEWDANMVRKEDIISLILDKGGIKPGIDVLDVACGTGVLFPDYMKRQVKSLTGIDISPEMVKIASEKFPDINIICDDVETHEFPNKFDAVMVYNAFPHFPNPESLIEALSKLLKKGGRLSVAHSMSKSALHHHHRHARAVSIDLLDEDKLAEIFSKWLDVDVIISNENMYQVSGVKK